MAHKLAGHMGEVIDLVPALHPLEAVPGREVVLSGHHRPATLVHCRPHELPAVGLAQVVAPRSFLSGGSSEAGGDGAGCLGGLSRGACTGSGLSLFAGGATQLTGASRASSSICSSSITTSCSGGSATVSRHAFGFLSIVLVRGARCSNSILYREPHVSNY